jgi:chemotaxis protein methyltransferase CheR
LGETFLPKLLERNRRAGHFRIRGWSAGCSSGEEAYSIAMMLDESLHDEPAWDAKILASDISTSMIQRAKAGVYSQKQVAPIRSTMLKKYLVGEPEIPCGEQLHTVRPALLGRISFRKLNLMDQSWPFSGSFDFIFCRNVMIYFD